MEMWAQNLKVISKNYLLGIKKSSMAGTQATPLTACPHPADTSWPAEVSKAPRYSFNIPSGKLSHQLLGYHSPVVLTYLPIRR